jgi:hypothetical protein
MPKNRPKRKLSQSKGESKWSQVTVAESTVEMVQYEFCNVSLFDLFFGDPPGVLKSRIQGMVHLSRTIWANACWDVPKIKSTVNFVGKRIGRAWCTVHGLSTCSGKPGAQFLKADRGSTPRVRMVDYSGFFFCNSRFAEISDLWARKRFNGAILLVVRLTRGHRTSQYNCVRWQII